MKTHKDLEVWKESIELVKQIYEITKEFPKEEVYGLTSQIKRCAVSIPANIAEGAARRARKEFYKFLIYIFRLIVRVRNSVVSCKRSENFI